jgi:hypothetical protein
VVLEAVASIPARLDSRYEAAQAGDLHSLIPSVGAEFAVDRSGLRLHRVDRHPAFAGDLDECQPGREELYQRDLRRGQRLRRVRAPGGGAGLTA